MGLVRYTVRSVSYDEESPTPRVELLVTNFNLVGGDAKVEFVASGRPLYGNGMYVYLGPKEVKDVVGLEWDGTPEEVEKLRKDLEGKTFDTFFNFGAFERQIAKESKRKKKR